MKYFMIFNIGNNRFGVESYENLSDLKDDVEEMGLTNLIRFPSEIQKDGIWGMVIKGEVLKPKEAIKLVWGSE